MKQAKLRAAGDNVDRQDVVEVIIEESVQAAQDGVMERFDEIARDRGFDDSAVGEKQRRDLGIIVSGCLALVNAARFSKWAKPTFDPKNACIPKPAQCPVTAVN